MPAFDAVSAIDNDSVVNYLVKRQYFDRRGECTLDSVFACNLPIKP